MKNQYQGEGYSQEPGHYPLNARELQKKKPPSVHSLYRNNKTRPEYLIGGGYGR